MSMSVRALAISGSLRRASSNGAILSAAARLAPADGILEIYGGLAPLPHFNPDLDRTLGAPLLPEPVRALRHAVESADVLVISSPEYAHGVPGSLKNALDWLVSAPGMVWKPSGLLNISPRSSHAFVSLAEILRTMSTVIVPGATVELALAGTGLDAAGIIAVPDFARTLRSVIDSLVDAVQ